MDIEGVFTAIQKQMNAELEGVRFALEHGLTKGIVNEDVVRNFLRSFLPSNLAIESGFLIDTKNGISKQLDIIIFDRAKTPTFFMGAGLRVIPVECAYAVIEVKTSLDTEGLKDCIANMQSVKVLEKKAFYLHPKAEFDMYDQTLNYFPVLFFVFCFENSLKMKTIAKSLYKHAETANERMRIDSLFSLTDGYLANRSVSGVLDSIPTRASTFVHIKTNALMLFYSLISHHLSQATLPNFRLLDYVSQFDYASEEIFDKKRLILTKPPKTKK